MSKKIVAMLMAVAMAFSLLPVTALATGGTQEGNSQPVTASDKNLTMNKTVKPNGDGTYTVCLESYATGSVTTTQAPVPMDFVLVLDVSGSMDGENGQIVSYGYQETKKKSWSAKDVYYSRTTYYAKSGEEYYPVSCQSEWVPGKWVSGKYIAGYYEYWLEANGQPLGNRGKWGKQLYSESLYIYGEVPDSRMSKLAAMKTAVNNFIESVAAQKNGNTPVAHRISIVKFAGDPKGTAGNDTYEEYPFTYNYTQKVTELTDVTTNGNVDYLKTTVNALTAGGATRADLGMEKADGVLNGRQGAEKDRPSVVVMFTDGKPTTSDGFEWNVAGAAVDTAKTLKNSGTKVYTIGMFTDADPSDINGAFNKYMNGVSSKYPGAVGTKKNNNKDYNGIYLGTGVDGNYYFKADNAGDLDQVFQTISESTTVTSPLNASAVVVDNVPSNFALTDGSVQVYTADCTGKNEKEELTWSETLDPVNSDITTTIPENKNEDGSQTISTTGFNFSGNWCGLDENNQACGKKLIIEFTIKCTNYGGTQLTNAGAYIKAKADDEKGIIKLNDPTVPVTISLGSNEELLEKLKVEEEKTYNGSGFAILSEVAKKVDALVNGTNKAKNAYVDMELTVTVGNATYTYKIPAGETAGKWYEGSSTTEMTDTEIAAVTTPKDVNRDQGSKEVKPYTYTFDLKLSDATPRGAAPAEYKNNTASFKITPKDVTVKAKDKTIQAGDPKPEYDATVSGTIGEETVKYDISCAYDPATSTEGTIPIVLAGAPTQGNYNVSYENGTLTVTKAPVTTGTLKVTKEVQGEDLTLKSLPGEFKITVTGPNSYNKSFSLPGNVGDSKTNTWIISNLTPGEYTVSEEKADVNGYNCTATYSATNSATVTANNANTAQNQPATDAHTVTVAADSTSTMTVTNKYTKKEVVPPTPADPVEWDVSRSKTASGLTKNSNGDWTTDVTLGLPSATTKQTIDVVLVVDNAFPTDNTTAATQAAGLMEQLEEIAKSGTVSINTGLVISGGYIPVLHRIELGSIEDNITNIKEAIDNNKTDWKQQEGRKGSNIQAGVETARQMLAGETSASKENKYLVLISDGGAFSWYENGTSVSKFYSTETDPEKPNYYWCNPWDFQMRYGDGVSSREFDFTALMEKPEAEVDANSIPCPSKEWPSTGNGRNGEGIQTQYQSNYSKATVQSTLDKYPGKCAYDIVNKEGYITSREAALYHTAKSISMASKEVKVIFVSFPYNYKNGSNLFKLTEGFKKYVADNNDNVTLYRVNGAENYPDEYKAGDSAEVFKSVKKDLIYLVDKGSKVEDTIGNKFTLIPDSFKLTVGGTKLQSIKDGENYYFGDETVSTAAYKFKVTVTKTESETKFDWDINEAITKDKPVKLTYALKLTDPQTLAGTYGVTDLNGDGIVDGTDTTKVTDGKPLYTNKSATMTPKDSQGNLGVDLEFPKPSVSYTVSSGSSGSHSGGSRPSLNTKDHYGYIIGYPVDYYTGQPTTDQTKKPVRPEGKITRAEVATIYFRMLTDESRTKFWSQNSGYSDVKTGDWFNNAVSTLSNAGIIAGYEDGSFRPNGYITRAEFATIAARFFDVTYNGKDLFPDISGHWAKDYINQAANKGFVNGYEDGTFKPDRNITRAEAVTLVNRTLDRHPDKNHFTKDMLVWPDNMDQTKWYYADMQEATNSHTYQMKENSDKTKYENWTKTLPIRNWEALEKAWSNANSSQGNGNVV